MEWLNRLVHAFIMTFGITQPSPENKRMATILIGSLMLGIVLALLAMIVFGVSHLT